MKVLFAHNIRMHKDNAGNLYTHSSYNNEIWKRYLSISTSLSVITRKVYEIEKKEYAEKAYEKFPVKEINNIETIDIHKSIYSFLNPLIHNTNKRIIKEAVFNHEAIVARIPSYAGYETIKYAKKYQKPYIVEVVACPWDGLIHHSIKGKIMAPFAYLNMKKTVKNSQSVVYVTNSFLQKRYPTNGKQINCSNVLLNNFNENVLMKRLKKICDMKVNQKFVIGTTAAVNVKFKGQQYIIKALGKLKLEGNSNFEYQLVGGGDNSYLKKIARKYNVEDQVKFLGSLSHSKVYEWLDTIDLYTQPSRQEGLPRALIEAMSRGLPAFGANTAGIPELINDNYIFNNTKNNTKEIIEILLAFNKEQLYEQARVNFEESKKYDKTIIDKRRSDFFKDNLSNTSI